MEKPFGVPALAVPRQADRKAGPGEAAWRGSNKPRPVCNGPDRPTSIGSFVVRKSMEPFLPRKANDDRRLSIGASWTRHEECRVFRPWTSMAKVGLGLAACDVARLSNRGTSDRRLSIERLELCEVKVSRTVLRGA